MVEYPLSVMIIFCFTEMGLKSDNSCTKNSFYKILGFGLNQPIGRQILMQNSFTIDHCFSPFWTDTIKLY